METHPLLPSGCGLNSHPVHLNGIDFELIPGIYALRGALPPFATSEISTIRRRDWPERDKYPVLRLIGTISPVYSQQYVRLSLINEHSN